MTLVNDKIPRWTPQDYKPGQHVVVVGAGFGGLSAARALAKLKLQVTIVDETNHHLFQPLLYQVASSGLNTSEIASPVRSIFSGNRNITCLLGEVTEVLYDQHVLVVDDHFHVPYDYLILAAGARTSYFAHPEWEKWAPGLKSLDDARRVREGILMAFELAEKAIDPEVRKMLMTMVVVGGGPTGVELAGALAELARHVLVRDFRHIDPAQARVVLIQHGPHLIPAFSEKLSLYAENKLRQMGVDVQTGTRVEDVQKDLVVTTKGNIAAANIIWAAGVSAVPLASKLGLPVDHGGRVAVDADLRLPGHDREYAIGDMTAYEHPHTYGGKMLPGLSPPAMQAAKWAAANIGRQMKGQPTTPFEYKDPGTMATIGRSAAVAQVKGFELTGVIAWLAWMLVHLINIVDFENRVVIFMRWAWAYLTWKRGARVVMGNEAQELEKVPNLPKVP